MPMQHGQGQANTAMIFHAKRLLALHEADLPYAVRLPGGVDAQGAGLKRLGKMMILVLILTTSLSFVCVKVLTWNLSMSCW